MENVEQNEQDIGQKKWGDVEKCYNALTNECKK